MEVTCEKELDEALAEMGSLTAQLSTINNECNREIELWKLHAQQRAVTTVGRHKIPIPTRLEELEVAVAEYCEANKSTLVPDPKKKKSKAFTHGEIGWRERRKSIADDPNSTEVRAGLLKRLITVVINCLKRFILDENLKPIKTDRLYNVKFEVNRTAVLELVKKEEITAEQLQVLGLKVEGGEDELWIKPAAVIVTPHPGPTQ